MKRIRMALIVVAMAVVFATPSNVPNVGPQSVAADEAALLPIPLLPTVLSPIWVCALWCSGKFCCSIID